METTENTLKQFILIQQLPKPHGPFLIYIIKTLENYQILLLYLYVFTNIFLNKISIEHAT